MYVESNAVSDYVTIYYGEYGLLENENECSLSDVMFEISLNQKNKILILLMRLMISWFLGESISGK